MSTIAPESVDICKLPLIEFGRWYKLPEIAAVYFCLNSKGQVLYIRQSIELKYRWAIRRRNKRTDCAEMGEFKLTWLEVTDGVNQRSALCDLEAKIIARFLPVLNMPTGIQPYQERQKRDRQIIEMKQAIAHFSCQERNHE